jgi:hypothetical protein
MPVKSAPHVGTELIKPATHEIHEQTVKDLKVNINREQLTGEQYEQLCELLHVNQIARSRSIFDLPGTHLVKAKKILGMQNQFMRNNTNYRLPQCRK